MTDFIHEHPKDETPASPPPSPAEETPMDEKTGQKRVYGYIFILFVVALSLLLWAFLMNQRGQDEVLSTLRGNASSLQSTLDRNVALEQQNEALEARVQELEKEASSLASQLDEAKARSEELEEENAVLLDASRVLQYEGCIARLEYAYNHKDYDLCRELIDGKLKYAYAEGVFSDEDDGPFAKAHFEEICAAVGMESVVENQ